MTVEASYDMDGWFKHETWHGSNRELKERANDLIRYGVGEIWLSDMEGGLYYYLERRRRQWRDYQQS